MLCALIAAGSLTVSANADSLKRVDRALYRYSDSGENLGKYTGFARSDDGRRHYYKKRALVKEKWIKTDSEITAEISLEDSFPFAVTYGREYFLRKKNGKKWEKVALPKDAAFTDEGYEINPGKTVTVRIPLSVYGKLSKEKYRIDQSFFVWENDKKQTEASLTFTIQ